MNKIWNPSELSKPGGAYSHCCQIAANARLLVVGGQVGVLADGSVVQGAEKHCEQALKNLCTALEANDMGPEDIAHLKIFLVDRAHLEAYRSAHRKVLAGYKPPGALIFVAGFANPEWLIEVEALAARPVEQ